MRNVGKKGQLRGTERARYWQMCSCTMYWITGLMWSSGGNAGAGRTLSVMPMILYAVFSTRKKQKYSGRGWKNVSGNMGWNLRKRRQRYWNSDSSQEGTKTGTWENPRKHLTSWALPFTAGWILGNVFSDAKSRPAGRNSAVKSGQ